MTRGCSLRSLGLQTFIPDTRLWYCIKIMVCNRWPNSNVTEPLQCHTLANKLTCQPQTQFETRSRLAPVSSPKNASRAYCIFHGSFSKLQKSNCASSIRFLATSFPVLLPFLYLVNGGGPSRKRRRGILRSLCYKMNGDRSPVDAVHFLTALEFFHYQKTSRHTDIICLDVVMYRYVLLHFSVQK